MSYGKLRRAHGGVPIQDIAEKLDRWFGFQADWQWDSAAKASSQRRGNIITIASGQVDGLIQAAGLSSLECAVYAYVMGHERGHLALHSSFVAPYYALDPSSFEIEADIAAGWACSACALPVLNSHGITPLANQIGDTSSVNYGSYPHPGKRANAYLRGVLYGAAEPNWSNETAKEVRNAARRQ